MTTLEFYTERAADCRRQASASTLVNVRDRCLSAAAAWETMADRVRRTEAFKADNEARKALEG
ncbi:MAG TPA: hypothetical protein VLM36_10155 [Sphingomicrobium sp.]|jgi:hypothetical protein|nr:hypothetical protein [Sphingomicrobium sp.]